MDYPLIAVLLLALAVYLLWSESKKERFFGNPSRDLDQEGIYPTPPPLGFEVDAGKEW